MTPTAPAADHSQQWGIDSLRRIVRRRWAIIVACVVLAPIAALLVSLAQPTQYTANASLLLLNPNFDQQVFGSTVSPSSTELTRRATTSLSLLGQEVVAARAATTLDIPISEVRGHVSVSATPGSDVVTVSATNGDAATAARISNAYATAFVELRRTADRVTLDSAKATVLAQLQAMTPAEQRSPNGESLTRRVNQLTLLRALQTGDVELTQPAMAPSSPSSPNTKLNVLAGLFAGIVLAFALTALAERLDRRVRDPDEARAIFDAPMLAVVPRFRAIDPKSLSVDEIDAFAMLRTNLSYYNVDSQVRRVLVTSPMQGDGKTTVAWLLAVASAIGDTKVILVDADLRHPSVADRAGVGMLPGLSEWLSSSAELSDVIRTARPSVGPASSGRTRSIDVIPAGGTPPNPTELIDSGRMSDLLVILADRYDLVIIDTPPISMVPDAIPLIAKVDGTIVVTRADRTTRDAAQRLHTQLTNLEARVLGVVGNSVRAGTAGYYGYGYGYGYGTSSLPDTDDPSAGQNGHGPKSETVADVQPSRRGE